MCIKNNLSVAGLVQEKDRLEASLSQCIASLVAHFKDRTGLEVRSIEVPMVEDTIRMAGSPPSFRVGRAKVNTNLV